MRQIALVTTVLLTLFLEHVDAGFSLNDLIEQNIETLQQSTETARLWVHVQSDSQKGIGKQILNRVKNAKLEERSIERKPVQLVASGPQESQLRYFKRQDKSEARELFRILRKLIPQLELLDLSSQYERVGWIKSGHYELWVSPDLVRLEPPE